MSLTGNGTEFARKLIHSTDQEVKEIIENEVRAVTELKNHGGHPNIVTVIRHGWLESPPRYFFIDMELCKSNLDKYIHTERSVTFEAMMTRNTKTVVYVSEDSGILIKMRNIWTIMSHISQGLQFMHMHGQVHRDLKPRNVLYSQRMNLWKIADFGITTEATSKYARTTHYARGTPGYRAPELIGEMSNFNTKVDVWALGCILFELVTGEKAFNSDWEARNHSTTEQAFPISASELPEHMSSHISEMLSELLAVDWHDRPRVADIGSIFLSYLTAMDPIITPTIDVLQLPPYTQWKQLIRDSSRARDLQTNLAENYSDRGRADAAIAVFKGLVIQFPEDNAILRRLREEYGRKGHEDATIGGFLELVETHPNYPDIQDELEKACDRKGDLEFSVTLWKRLVEKYPKPASLQLHLRKSLSKLGDDNITTAAWKELVDEHPSERQLLEHLAVSYERNNDNNSAIETWDVLSKMYPDEMNYRQRVVAAFGRSVDECHTKDATGGEIMELSNDVVDLERLATSYAAIVWNRIVTISSNNTEFLEHFLELYVRCDAAMAFWKSEVISDPELRREIQTHVDSPSAGVWRSFVRSKENKTLRALAKQFQELGDIDLAIMLLKDLVDKDPRNEDLRNQLREAFDRKGDVDTAYQGWRELTIKHPWHWALRRQALMSLRTKSSWRNLFQGFYWPVFYFLPAKLLPEPTGE